jgi:hypothetical protein
MTERFTSLMGCSCARRLSPFVRTCSTVLLLVLIVSGSAAADDVVTQWNEFLLTFNSTVISPATAVLRPPNAASLDMAYVHIAMYDAVTAIEGGYRPFAVSLPSVVPGASPAAAAVAAAYAVLKNKVYTPAAFPSVQARIDAEYALLLAQIPSGQSKTDGIAIGQAVAAAFINLRQNDGLNANVPYTFQPVGPGVYQKTPGPPPTFAYAGPVTPWEAKFTPFAIHSPSQFRAEPPPSLTSDQWADDFNEVKAFGAAIGSVRTPEQDQIGLFYGLENAAFQAGRAFRNLAAVHQLTLTEDARFFAQEYVTTADALVGCWDSKYHYNFWRPITAIHEADIDGNDATQPDLNWSPQVVTPGHPEYPSAHGCFTSAYAHAIAQFFDTKHLSVRLFSRFTPLRPYADFDSTDDIIKEIIAARVYNGVHYRTSVVEGAELGSQVSHWVARHYFQPVDKDSEKEDRDSEKDDDRHPEREHDK